MRPHTVLSAPGRFVRRLVVLVAAAVLLVATPAVAAVGAYGIAPGTGTFSVLTTRNLVTDFSTSDQMFYLSTTATGLRKLPFPIRVYDGTYRNIAVSTHGNVQFGVTSPGGNPTLFFECLPTATDFGAPVAFVLWGIGLRYFPPDGDGIFVRTQGTAPKRTFTISWQGQFQASAVSPANAQITFRENSRTITYQYGPINPQNIVTIGIQSQLGDSYTERFCDGHGRYPTNGTRLTLGYVTG